MCYHTPQAQMKRQFQAFSYKVVNKAEDTLDVFIDGIIVDAETQEILKSWFGDETSVSYKSFRNQIIDAKPKVLNVHFNSGGGMVTDAMAMHDFLIDQKKSGVKVNTIGRGIVASAATFPFMAGGENASLSENSWLMIHNVSGGVWGDVNMIESYARATRKFNDRITNFYAESTGLSTTIIGNMMDAETWMDANEAKEKGFVKNVTGKVEFSNSIKPENWPFENTAILNSYNAQVKEPENHSFLNVIKNEFMKIKDSLLDAINGGKTDKKYENVAERAAILDMVKEVLEPVINKIDEAIKPEASTEGKPIEETKPNTEKPKEETKEVEEVVAESEDVIKLKAENKKLAEKLAAFETKPETEKSNGAANVVSKVKIEYEN